MVQFWKVFRDSISNQQDKFRWVMIINC
jgi:hypothetical protein